MKMWANSFLFFTNKKIPNPKGEILMGDLISSLDQEIIDLLAFKFFPLLARDRLKVFVVILVNQLDYSVLYV